MTRMMTLRFGGGQRMQRARYVDPRQRKRLATATLKLGYGFVVGAGSGMR